MTTTELPYFPVKHGTAAFAPTLDAVRHHRFPSTPLCCQGFLSRDVGPDRAEKEFLSVNHFSTFIQTDILESQEDRHLYELVTERTAVRPYFDLEWDPTQLDEAETLYTAFLFIGSVLAEHGAQGRGVSVFCASNGVKASYHLLFDTVQVFRNAKELGWFVTQYVMPRIPDTLRYHDRVGRMKCVIDAAPYGSSQSFRLPYQSKWKSMEARRFLPFPVADVEKGDPFYKMGRKGRPTDLAALSPRTWDVPEAGVATIGVYEPVCAWLLEEGPAQAAQVTQASRSAAIHKPLKGAPSPEYDKVVALCALLTPVFLQDYKAAMNLIFCLWNVEQTDRMCELVHSVCRRAANYEYKWVQNLMRSWKYSAFSVGSLVLWAASCSSKDAVSAILKQHVVTYQDELFSCMMRPSRHTVVCERYVSAVSFDSCDTIILQSHLGTGKTVAITGLIRHGGYERVLIVSPRKSYTYSQVGTFASEDSGLPVLSSYMDHSGSLGHLPCLIVQAESLWRVRGAVYDLVIMDESESILCQMHSIVTHGSHMITNHGVLERVVREARHVVCADAFVSDRTFHMVSSLRRKETTHFIENTYQPYVRTAIALAPIHKDRRVANLGALCERIMGALGEGRKIVVLWTSKRRGEWFVENFLKKTKYVYRFYSSASSKEDVAGLQDVSVTWRGVQCLMMTTSITVGLSYDPKDAAVEFDEAFLYGTSASAIPRDIAQALLRVRVLKGQRLTYVLETRAAVSGEGHGLRAVTAALTLKEEHLMQTHPLVAWADCPVWARYNHCYNVNEERISRAEYRGVLERYLRLSGYTLVEEIHVPEEAVAELLKAEVVGEAIQWDQVDDVSAESAEDILERMRKGEATKEEIVCYKKAMFRMQFLYGTEEDVLKALWSRFFVAGHEGRFWNVVKERRQTITSLAWEEAEARYGIMATGCVKARETIGVLLEILGMKHSQESVVLGPERLAELAGPLEAAEKGLREGLGLAVSRRKGNWSVSNTIDLITGLLETWGCSVVESDAKKIYKDKKRCREYTLTINPNNKLWENIVVRDVEYEESMFKF